MSHILVFPFPTSGHVIPLLDLTKTFLHRGITVTIAITPDNLQLLDPFLSTYPPAQLHHIVLPAPDYDKTTYASRNRLFAYTMFMRDTHYPILLNWFRSHSSPPLSIISDFFLGWTYNLASELGLPRLVFSPSGAFGFSVNVRTWLDDPQNDNPENQDSVVSFLTIPNCPSFPWWQLSHLYKLPRDSDWEFFRESFLANMKSWGIVFNSFTELERLYIDHMKKEFGHDRVWAVGPVLPSGNDFANRGGTSSVPCHDVLTWLDSRKDNSVVYVAFGSRANLTCQQMAELASGLEKSRASFILCVRQQGDESVLPEGFEDRVRDRGYVIKGWAPQVSILRHKAVGSFVTHCGWNSVLEGISAGVVMLTWPMSADQFANANLLVDELKIGIRVGESIKKIPESAELVKILTKSVEENLSERVKAREMQEAALKAIQGGSSEIDLNVLVQSLKELKQNKNTGVDQ